MGLLRLFLASLVLISHMGINLGGLHLGVGSVVVFYLLAGHVVSRLWRRRPAAAVLPGALWFYRDRLWRILPLYAYSLGVAVLVWWLGAQSPFLAREPDTMDWLANLLVLPLNYYMFSGQDAFTLLPPAWSLAVELQFYLLVPLLLARPAWALAAAGGSLLVFAIAQLGWLNTDIFGYRLLPGICFVFLAGTLLGDQRRFARVLLGLLWLLSTLYATWLLLGQRHVPFNTEVALGLALGLPVLGVMGRLRFTGRWDRLQRRAGELSYGVFLLHFPAIWLLQLGGYSGPWTAWAVWLISAALAWLGHRAVERPLWRKYRTQLPTMADGPRQGAGQPL